MATTALRFLLSRGRYKSNYNSAGIDQSFSRTRRPLDVCRYASSTTPPATVTRKPRVLGKPLKYNPPSHPSRINQPPPRNFPGPQMSPEKIEERKNKRYPHMMPPEGSFMFWFLTNKYIHMCICLSILTTLAATVSIKEFLRTSPFAHLTPPVNTALSHPIAFITQWSRVLWVTDKHNSDMALARRKKKLDDVDKRRVYRKAHGLDKRPPGMFSWLGLAEEEEEEGKSGKPGEAGAQQATSSEQSGTAGAEDSPSTDETAPPGYTDWEGRRRPPVKRWFGIWT